jgi:NAD(P)-dependent dehydrogenase (short-subunit alcohol dehydrogenase family)
VFLKFPAIAFSTGQTLPQTLTWFITGTSTGLGRLLTEPLLLRGDRVIATLRKPGALDDLQASYGDRLHSRNRWHQRQKTKNPPERVFSGLRHQAY